MNLYDDLSKISKRVKSQLQQMKNNEAATINVSVQPVIRALGYDMENLSEVYPEYPILNMDAVDYAIMRDGKPKIFIEAKNANLALDKHWKQLFQYFNADDVIVGILTNGIEYRFYTDLKKSNIMDKEPFMTIDMLNLDKRLVKELEGFAKSSFDPERIIAGAQRRVLMQLLRQEMERPSDEFVRHFARLVHSGRLPNSDIQRFAQLVKEAWLELMEQKIADRMQPEPDKEDSDNGAGPVLSGTEVPVFGTYKGRRFKATLMIDDSMRLQREDNMLFDGKPMNHAVAAFEAVKKVDPLMKKWPTGWIFWRFIDSDTGEERPIKEIFEEVWTRNSSNGY